MVNRRPKSGDKSLFPTGDFLMFGELVDLGAYKKELPRMAQLKGSLMEGGPFRHACQKDDSPPDGRIGMAKLRSDAA